jgi:hypothetical protein
MATKSARRLFEPNKHLRIVDLYAGRHADRQLTILSVDGLPVASNQFGEESVNFLTEHMSQDAQIK